MSRTVVIWGLQFRVCHHLLWESRMEDALAGCGFGVPPEPVPQEGMIPLPGPPRSGARRRIPEWTFDRKHPVPL